jgi:hypothetical protein
MINTDFELDTLDVSDEVSVSGGEDACQSVVEAGAFTTAGGLGVASHSLAGAVIDPEPVSKSVFGFVTILAGVVAGAGVVLATAGAIASSID